MKKLTKKTLNKIILEELSLFLEGEDDAGGEDLFAGGEEEEAADEGGEDDEAADDAEGGEEGGDEEEAGGEEEGEDDEAPEGPPEADLSDLPADERADLTKAVDDELNNLFMDFEASALQSVAVEDEIAIESYQKRLKRYLFEAEEATPIDVHQFANDTARLINHYHDLLDMESLIYNKAKVFLLARYTQADVDEFEEVMLTDHDIDLGDKKHPEPFGDEGMPETPWPPRAVGAQTPTG